MAAKMKKRVIIGLLLALLLIGVYFAAQASESAFNTSAIPTSSAVPDLQVESVPTVTADDLDVNAHPPASTPKPSKESYSAEVSHDKAAQVKDEISLSEQMKITAILLNKLSASDLKLFQNLFDSGMSLEEKKKAKEVIMKKLTEEEYDELIAIASKYGLSKGKSYEESLKEQK
ncbi:hypothetical protein [Paenibacillus sp. Soil787]|uniref:hypothetical protein n=1 Tax=Paenibacillus sp. Soil787 TaxID=1736411 RepID=UPI00070270BD|nr:hypothetical protein [Paenibacillus sp. Soil787]KRF21583.1 hypothetical protein ASG93_09510 [Paenibacillus sp. Soil787]